MSTQKSLIRSSVNYLIVTGTLIAILTAISSYAFLSYKSNVQYKQKLQEHLSYLKHSLELPVWRLDKTALEHVCLSFAQNETVGLIQVLDEDGALLFETGVANNDLLIESSLIRHKGETIGKVVLGLSPILFKQRSKELLLTSILMAMVIILGLSISISLVLKRYLSAPLNELIARIQKMASGDYSQPSQTFKHIETAQILRACNAMAEKVNSREKALVKSKEKHQRLIENLVSSFVYIHDTDGNFIYVSNSVTKILGYACQDFLTHYTSHLTDHPVNLKAREHTELTIKGKQQQPYELEIFHADGSVRWLEVAEVPIFDPNHKVIYAEGIAYDITTRKKAEKALQEEKAFTESIINSMPGIFYTFNQSKRLIKWNKHLEKLLGKSAEEITREGVYMLERIPDNEKDAVYKQIQLLDKKDGPVSFETHFVTDGGKKIPMLYTADQLVVEHEQYILGVGFDISDLKKLESELQHSQKMESIGTLAGGIAHDFNNILAAIFGYAELAQEDIDNPEKLKKELGQILKGAGRARNLVQQILTFSRKTEPEKKPLQVSTIIKEALKLLRSSIPSTITIKQDIFSEARVLADPTHIHQITMNLCTNAYHAMRDTGGILHVKLEETERSYIVPDPELELPDGKLLKLSISDTGKGIDNKTKAKIFDPYFTTKTKGEGTGLGLAVVHGIVKSHGGNIHVFSEPGKGTDFNVYLPVYQGKDIDETADHPKESITGGDETIMLVDDEQDLLEITSLTLKKRGYTVFTYTNGVQAFQEFQQEPEKFDLVITDMTMPHMTGIQLSHQILETRPEIPIILCTGHSEITNREKALATGIKEYLEKPLDRQDLARTVRQVLDASQEKKL